MRNTSTAEVREIKAAEDIWLNYFNQYLFECGTITEREYRQMIQKISERNARQHRGYNSK